LEPGTLVVVLVLIEDPVKMRELPREDVGSQEHRLDAEDASGLGHSPDQRGERADDGSHEGVPR
jgi:hypothetical protein